MNDETVIKLVIAGICSVVLLYVGVIALAIIVPLALVAWIVDQFFQAKYNKKLEEHRNGAGLTVVPEVTLYTEKGDDGVPLIAWDSKLLEGCSIEIYRLAGEAGTSIYDIREKGALIFVTSKSTVETDDDVIEDYDAPMGTVFYVPIMTGNKSEERACGYSSYSFNSTLRFVKKVQPFEARGHGVKFRRVEAESIAITDERSSVVRLKDEILKDIKKSKADEAELDEAINLITQDDGLTENEKAIAIEKLESQFEPN